MGDVGEANWFEPDSERTEVGLGQVRFYGIARISDSINLSARQLSVQIDRYQPKEGSNNHLSTGHQPYCTFDLGINLVNTASAYSASGQRIGKLITHHLHGEYILISKDSELSLEPRTHL